MAEGTFYLRPIADVSLEHTIYPSTLSAGYLAISEEVCDNEATYIGVFESDSNIKISVTGTSRFGMTVQGTEKILSITSANLIICAQSGSVKPTVYANDVQYSMDTQYFSTSYEEITVALTDEIVLALNEYITNNGCLPTIEVEVYSKDTDESSNDGKTQSLTAYQYISQMYIELSCEYEPNGLNIHTKSNGEWKQATAAYQKQNGAWIEITEDECKSILQNSFCTS